MRSRKLRGRATQAAADRLIEQALIHAGAVVAAVGRVTTKPQQRALADSLIGCKSGDWRCLEDVRRLASEAGAGWEFDEMRRLVDLADRLI